MERNILMEDEFEIVRAFQNYFTNIFNTSPSPHYAIEQITQAIKPIVTETMNNQLLQNYTKKEVFEALKQMGPFKSPRLDGFGASFY